MSNAERLLQALDNLLNRTLDLTLYGRAALQLGFPDPPPEIAASRDVDAVLWLGQAEELAATSNFWEAVETVNGKFAGQDLYISHLFEEDQVILQPSWREHRVKLGGDWRHLSLHRLGNLDLFLTKLMRDDPIDLADARFIVERAKLTPPEIQAAIHAARVPDIPELREQFDRCSKRFLAPR